MKRQGRSTRGRALAAAAVGIAVAITVLPAHAVPPLVGTAAFEGAYADDGFINAAEALLADPSGRPVVWTTDDVTATAAEGRFTDATDTIIAGGNCGPFNLAPNGSGTSGFLNLSCMGAAPEGEIRWQVRWKNAADEFSDWVSDSIIVDRIAPDIDITAPVDASLNSVVVKSGGARVLTVEGTTDEGNVTVSLVETTEGLLGTTTSDANGQWSKDVQLESGTYTIVATAIDAAGNAGASDQVTFDLDADLPFAEVTSPPDMTVALPGEPLIIEGIAADTNGQAFGGLLAVEVNIHDPLLVDVDPSGTRGNILGYLNVGEVFHQENANCQPSTACPAGGVTQVSWKYDASWLPSGTYTLQILAHDKAGNEAVQPAVVRVVKL